ncbi:MAG: CRISPR-associated helicase Cas3' [Thermomonas sp.]
MQPGRMVFDHCRIVGEVARALIARYPPRLGEVLFPEGSPLAAASHDTGKVSPTFFNKLMKACQLPQIPGFLPEIERQWGGHAGVSQAALKAMHVPRWIPEIAGQHHGFSPNLAARHAEAEQFGGAAWQEQRLALVEELKACMAMDWPQPASVAQARLIAGLTSVSDWIGSGRHFENPGAPWQPNIERALDEAGFVPPVYRKGLSFQEIFGFPARPAQQQLIDAAMTPGMYVLEAPMGLGKTEAALYVAYRLLEQGQACGVYFALPTQLTSNKIHERFNQFLDRVLDDGCPQRALLLHANAWLVDTEMGEEGRPGGAWFNHAKRGLLAPFAVGTIDQALMAAMHVKHGFVRAFGLAGKVVILDEVHTYDAYTGALLDALVKLLRELRCTVIILSATLNQQRRSQLLQVPLTGQAYPLITALPAGEGVRELPVLADAGVQVAIHLERDDTRAVDEVLERAAAGQQVLWVENTVKEAQQRYLDIASRASALGVEHGLLHSRYTMADRARIEERWVNLFGKPGRDRRSERGRILVGTQVLEQSLDIDADFLVSRFAPTDMLLQRMGRLWRHADTPRPTGARCEAWLLAPTLDVAIDSPSAAFGLSAYVYAPYVLCRSLAVWCERSAVALPNDIRALIEATYVEQSEDGAMARWLHELNNGTPRRKGRTALAQLARLGLAMDGNTLPESKAQTRYSETDSLDVLLLRDMQQDTERHVARLVLLDGSVVELPTRKALPQAQRGALKTVTAQLMRQIVPVRPGDAPTAIVRDTLEKYGLQHCFYLGSADWAEDESLLRVALVDDAGTLRGLHGQVVHDKYPLEYRDDLGYRVIKS